LNGERVGSIEEVNGSWRASTRGSLLLVIQRGPFAYQLPFALPP
jgi:hypothetical protein